MHAFTLHRAWLFGTMLMLLAASCGGSSAAGRQDVETGIEVSAPDEGGADLQGGDGVADAPDRYCRRIVILREDATELTTGTTWAIPVKVFELQTGAPVAGACLSFAIVAQSDLDGATTTDGDAGLAAATAVTGDNGIAIVDLATGQVPDRLYTIEVSSCDDPCGGGPAAEAQRIQVRVVKAPSGCFDVALAFDGTFPDSALKDVKVSVLPAAYDCMVLRPEKPLPGAVIQQKTLTDLFGTTTFTLPAGNDYTVFVTAKGPSGCIVASACRDGVFVHPGEGCHDLNLELHQVALVPTGCFEANDHFDFTQTIAECANGIEDPLACFGGGGLDVGSQVCCALHQLVTFFDDPGTIIVNLIIDAAEAYLGTLIGGALDLFADAVAKIVSDWLLNHSPAWVKDFLETGQKVMDVITVVHLHSDLCFSKLQNDYTVEGAHAWTGLTLVWIDGSSLSFDLEQLQNTQFPLNLVQGKFTASIQDFDKLVMDNHHIKLNYGKLVLFVLNEVVIARVTEGQCDQTPDKACHSLDDVLHEWLDCAAIAQGILGEIASWFGGGAKDVEQACDVAVDNVGVLLAGFLGGLTLDTYLSLDGYATLVDSDCDLVVDEIVDGHYSGQIESGSGSGSHFTGTWEAVRN